MAALDVGRVCIKTAGREAGKYCVVVKKVDDNFVFVTGPKVLTGIKRRRCNVEHLEPTENLLKIKSDASEKEVIDGYQAAHLLTKLGLGKPSPEVVKEAEKKVPKTEEKKEEVEEKKIEEKEEKPKEEKAVRKRSKEKLPKKGAKGEEVMSEGASKEKKPEKSAQKGKAKKK